MAAIDPGADIGHVHLKVSDLDTRVTGECLADDAAMCGEQAGLRVPVLVEEARRALDVGEDERDGAAGQVPHARSVRQRSEDGRGVVARLR